MRASKIISWIIIQNISNKTNRITFVEGSWIRFFFPPQVYLLDYGLVYRFSPDGNHKEYKEDPKRKHDGTIEFTSRDAHNGVGKLITSCQTFSRYIYIYIYIDIFNSPVVVIVTGLPVQVQP